MTDSNLPSPPQTAVALLRVCLPQGPATEAVLGDLHEIFLDRAEAGLPQAKYLRKAVRWYWRQAIGLSSRYLLRRLVKSKQQDVAPILSIQSTLQPSRGPLMNDVWKDIRFACRLFVRSPGFTLASVLVLAIGIGAVTVMFSTLNSVVLQPLPYDNPSQLAWMWGSNETRPRNSVSAINYWDYRDEAEAFESLAAVLIFSPRVILTGDDEPERVLSTRVSYNFFSVLGVSAQIGRAFLPEEELAGATNVVVVSDGFWQRRFGGDGSIVGSPVTISGLSFEVVGVLPPDFEYRAGVEMWFPMQRESDFTQGRGNNNFSIFGRLNEGMPIEQAQAQVDMIAQRLQTTYPETNDGWGVTLESMHEVLVGGARSSLLIMLGLVGLVLVIACANVASLSLARAMTRTTEVAVRFSLGAARSRVIRQMLTESVLIAFAGGVGGLVVAFLGISALKAFGPANLPRLDTVGINATVLAFTFSISLLASLVFGVVPALRSTNLSLSETLKVGGTRGTSHGRAGFRNALVVTQVALSLMLMAASGLLVKSYLRMQGVDPGFEVEHLLQAEIQLPNWRYEAPEEIENAWRQLHDRLLAMPGVVSVGAVDQVPIRPGGTWNVIYPVERPPTNAAEQAQFGAQRRFASDDYFEALGIPILTGRAFESTDRVGSPSVLIISNTMAERWFPDENPVGKELSVWGQNWQVVGVAADVREFGLAQDYPALFYMSSFQVFPDRMQLLIRSAGEPLDLAAELRRTVWEFDRSIPIAGLETMESRITGSLAQPRFRMLMVGLFAAMALVLAATGLYGVLAFFVRQRIHELGIRVALGAAPRNVIGVVLRRGMILVGVGIGVGLVGGFAGGRLLQSLLFDVAATDVLTFGGVSICLAVVASIACIVPARRALKVDPQEVLRVE
jgi:putative ABC transport system permease protein